MVNHMSNRGKTAIELAAGQLRSIVLACEEGALVGSEESLIARLGYSRSTVRQVARLLEREGLLRVRRGASGGYFAARPDAATIENTVSSYLLTIDTDPEDTMLIASALWIEVARKAARRASDKSRAVLETCKARLAGMKPDSTFAQILSFELESRTLIFGIADCRYVELIYNINMGFAQRTRGTPIEDAPGAEQQAFFRRWREARMMELAAMAEGEEDLAGMAAQHTRHIWTAWIQQRTPA